VIAGKRWWSLRPGTKVLIEDYGWGVVQDLCPECTPENPNWAGTALGRGVNLRFGEVRIDVFGDKDLGIRQIWIYNPPR
jgi:hypothetical protein